MSSYPRWPQPILRQASTGKNWYLEVTRTGILQAANTTLDAPWPDQRVTLVSTDRTKAYRFGLDASGPPLITMTEMAAAAFGGYEDLFVFSGSGREWAVQVDNAGALTVKSLSSSWNVQTPPALVDPAALLWSLSVADDGIYSVGGPSAVVAGQPSAAAIQVRSEDNNAGFSITVTAGGILNVDPIPLPSCPENYGFQLTAPGGLIYLLTVDSAGILYIDTSLQDALNLRDEWTVVFAKNNTIFYVVDERFRPPVGGSPARFGFRRR